MSRFLRLALLVGTVALLALPLPAVTYYVAVGGNDSNPGTAAQPFATIGKAVSSISAPGDIVLIGAGEYVENATYSLTVNGPVIFSSSDATRPVLKAMKFVVSASHYTFDQIIFDASDLHKSNFDLWRPAENLMFSSCDLMGASDFDGINEVNLLNSGDEFGNPYADEAANLRIWGASGITLSDCDFFSNIGDAQYGCVYVVNASGNTIDATGYDTSILSDITLINCNSQDAAQHFLVMRRPVENVTLTGCEAAGTGYMLYGRQSNRVGSTIAQQGSGGLPAATCRNYEVTNCSATMYSMITIDDATDATNGPAGDYLFEDLRYYGRGYGCIILDDNTSSGADPAGGDNSGNWMGHFANITIRNVKMWDETFATTTFSIGFGGGQNNDAGMFDNVLVDNCSMEARFPIYFRDGFGGSDLTFQNSSLHATAGTGVQMLLHDSFAHRFENVTFDNLTVNSVSTSIRAEDGASNHFNGYDNFTITDCNPFSSANVAYFSGDAVILDGTFTGNQMVSQGNFNHTFFFGGGGNSKYTNFLIDNNTVLNDTVNALWGLLVNNGVSGYLTITNNVITTQETGIGLRGDDNDNILVDNNVITVGRIPPDTVLTRGTFQALQFWSVSTTSATATNNDFITLRPTQTNAGDRGTGIGIEGLSNIDVLDNVMVNNNTYTGLWPRYLYINGAGGSKVANSVFENETCTDGNMYLGLFRVSGGAKVENVVIRNLSNPGAVFQGDAMAIYGGRADGLLLENLFADCANHPANDWGGVWASNGGGDPANDVTFRDCTFVNTGGPAIYSNGPMTNWTIEDCVVQNSGNLGGTFSAFNMNGAASTFEMLNNLVLDSRGGIRLTGDFNVVSGNIIGMKGDSTLNGIDVADGMGSVIKRNGIAGPGVAPAGVADGTGIVLQGSSATLAGATVYNNSFAGFANGIVISGSGNTVYNNAFAEITGVGLTLGTTAVGNVANFNAYDAGTAYMGTVGGAKDVVASDLGIASYDPTSNAFMLPVTSPPSPLVDAGADNTLTADGTTDIGMREAGSVGPGAPAGFTAPYVFLDTNNGLDANDGLTIGTPKKTWTAALTQVPAAGWIYIVGGPSIGGVTADGEVDIFNVASAANPLVIMPATGENPTVREQLNLWGTSNVMIAGLAFDASTDHRANVICSASSSNTTFDGCSFTGVAQIGPTDKILNRGTNSNIYVMAAPNTVINNCQFSTTAVQSYAVVLENESQIVPLENNYALISEGGVNGTLSGLTVTNCGFTSPSSTYGVVCRRGIHDVVIDDSTRLNTGSANSLFYLRSMDARVGRRGGYGPWENMTITNCTQEWNGAGIGFVVFDQANVKNVLMQDCYVNDGDPGGGGRDTYAVRFAGTYFPENRTDNLTVRRVHFTGAEVCMHFIGNRVANMLVEDCNFNPGGSSGNLMGIWYQSDGGSADPLHINNDVNAWSNITVRNSDFINQVAGRNMYFGWYAPAINNGLFENLTLRSTGGGDGNVRYINGALNNMTFRDIDANSLTDPNVPTSGGGRGLWVQNQGGNAGLLALASVSDVTFQRVDYEGWFAGVEFTGTHNNALIEDCTLIADNYQGFWGNGGTAYGDVTFRRVLMKNRTGREPAMIFGRDFRGNVLFEDCQFINARELNTFSQNAVRMFTGGLLGTITFDNCLLTTPGWTAISFDPWTANVSELPKYTGSVIFQDCTLEAGDAGLWDVSAIDDFTFINCDVNTNGIALFMHAGSWAGMEQRGAFLVQDSTIVSRANSAVDVGFGSNFDSVTIDNSLVQTTDVDGLRIRDFYTGQKVNTVGLLNSVIDVQPGAGTGSAGISLWGVNTAVGTFTMQNTDVLGDDWGFQVTGGPSVDTLAMANCTVEGVTTGAWVVDGGSVLGAGSILGCTLYSDELALSYDGSDATNLTVAGCTIDASNLAAMRFRGNADALLVQSNTITTWGADTIGGTDACILFQGNTDAAPNLYANVAIANNDLTGGGQGIAVQPVSYNVVSGSSVFDASVNLQLDTFTITGNSISYPHTYGIHMAYLADATDIDISGENFILGHGGMAVWGAQPYDPVWPDAAPGIAVSGNVDGLVIDFNAIAGNGTGSGIRLGDPNEPAGMITNVSVTDNAVVDVIGNTGVALNPGAVATVSGNVLHSNAQVGAGGELASDGNTFTSNTVVNFQTGADITGDNNEVFNNIFANCGTGLNLDAGATGSLVSFNGYAGNTTNAAGYTLQSSDKTAASAGTEFVSLSPYDAAFVELTGGSVFVNVGSFDGLVVDPAGALDMGAVPADVPTVGIETWRQF